MDIKFIRQCVQQRKLRHTRHSAEARLERGLSNQDIKGALLSGEIIEREPHDFPRPSALVLGWLKSGDPLHIKVARGRGEDFLTIVTISEPDGREWESDYKTRKKRRR
jgi:hypothetical protein